MIHHFRPSFPSPGTGSLDLFNPFDALQGISFVPQDQAGNGVSSRPIEVTKAQLQYPSGSATDSGPSSSS